MTPDTRHPKPRSLFGQSTLEYVALAALVVTGILLMGPYVIRSINSYFTASEEAAKDSFAERFQSAPVVNKVPQCQCDAYAQGACGAGGCKPDEHLFTRACAPLGCDVTSYCGPSDPAGCCQDQAGSCGGSATTMWCPQPEIGQRVHYLICGGVMQPGSSYCAQDDSCKPQCSAKGPNSTWCEETIRNVTTATETSYIAATTGTPPGDCLSLPPSAVCVAQCDKDTVIEYNPVTSKAIGCTYCGNGICEDGQVTKAKHGPDRGETCTSCPADCTCPGNWRPLIKDLDLTNPILEPYQTCIKYPREASPYPEDVCKCICTGYGEVSVPNINGNICRVQNHNQGDVITGEDKIARVSIVCTISQVHPTCGVQTPSDPNQCFDLGFIYDHYLGACWCVAPEAP